MPWVILCTRGHALLAEPADLAGAARPGPCVACGSTACLGALPLPQGPSPEQLPPGYDVLHRLEGATMAASPG
jgi:hypothetical protein